MQSDKHLEDKPRSKKRSEAYLKYQRYIRSKEFKENVREKVLERDNYTCQVCGRTLQNDPKTKLSCHHRSYKHLFCNDEQEINDCITLCKICHCSVHRAPSNFKRFKRE